MISMQRSLSSPVRIHSSSAPLSPDDEKLPTSANSRSPTPSLDDHASFSRRMRRPCSPSPPPVSNTNVSLPLRRNDDAPRRPLSQQYGATASARKPVIAQPVTPSSTSPVKAAAPKTPPSVPSDTGAAPFAPSLLPELSQYSSPFQAHDSSDGTTLEELAHLVRLSKYQERKRANTRIRLQRNLISTALSARLTRCGEIARRNLADCFRKDDKKVFGPLFNAIHDVRKSCDGLRQYALLEPEMDTLSDNLEASSSTPVSAGPLAAVAPFLNEIPASARETFLNFLNQIRTNPDYLATRLCTLTTTELNALTSFHQVLEPIESVLPFHGRPAPRTHASGNSSRYSTQQNTAIERLLSFQRHDPLSALIHTCFANSAGPDSAEDRRRTDIWATAMAKLITDSRANKVQSEHMLISVMNVWTTMRDWAGKSNMECKLVDSTRNWFVWKWLFSSFLLHVIIHPESFGMMADYHITEYGRQTILKKVALKAQELVVNMTCYKKGTMSVPAKVQDHVDNILGRFRGARPQRQMAKLLPARSITSLRETVEVHPYLVISPADLVTLVNALFPERRPMSAHSSGLRSGAPSISGMSGISQPISMGGSRSNFETTSVLSTSASSVVSDATTSQGTAFDDHGAGSPQRYSPPALDLAAQQRLNGYEDDGYRLRFALRELSAALGMETVQGSCHPCADRWAVLFISSDGNSLSTQMTYDPEDEIEEEENSSTSDTDDDEDDGRPELDKDYHQLRDSVLKLVEDFEIPQSNEPEANRAQFSNRATGIKRYRSKNKVVTTERSTPNRNPYRGRDAGQDTKSPAPEYSSGNSKNDEEPAPSSDSSSVLVAMLTAASAQSRAQSDFVSAHLYWKTLQQLNAVTATSLRRDGFAILLNIFSRGPRDSIRRSASGIEEYDAWLVWLKQSQERHEGLIDGMMRRLRALRDKMWYVSDVRTSAPYEHTRNICAALKTMGMPRRWGTFQRNRAHSARGTANYLYRTESQIMDLLCASEEQGGPNKLSDDQADKTSRWLEQADVTNFCRGEERIHRFCCEVDTCISKLVGESIMDGPVLWSSELYLRDRKTLEGFKSGRDREPGWGHGADDGASIISEPERRFNIHGRSVAMPRDLRSMSTHNASQQSFDSGSYRFSKASTALSDIIDGQDYFGASSPVHTIDSSSTFWSPFQSAISPSTVASRAHSPTTSVTNLSSTFHAHSQSGPSFSGQSTGRPGTSASSNETVYQQRLSEEKTRFFTDLRQTLTSLLLSDLGNFVFASGAETDVWFESLGQECIERRNALDRRAKGLPSTRGKLSKASGKPRVIEKKKSCGDLRNAGETDKSPETTETASVPGTDSTTTPVDTASTRHRPILKDSTPEFPYKKAYQRLLRMFCVHPNPYAKLNALYELEQLILASLATGGTKRSRMGWNPASPHVPDNDGSGGSGRPTPLEDDMDNVKERRSHALLQSPVISPTIAGSLPLRFGSLDTRTVGVPNLHTDAVVDVLRTLLRDASIRPQTLFRDLQFIAAFVHPAVLDKTDKGKAFWDTGLAALGLKSEVCRTMLDVADEVQKAYRSTQERGKEPHAQSSDSLSQPSSPAPVTTTYSLADAGRMWTVLAKEGDTAAQRELALFYLMDPELLERTTLPLSKPREVFKQAVMDKYGRGSRSGARFYPSDRSRSGTTGNISSSGHEGGAEEGATVWNDPSLMCIAIHFFQAAEQGGDGPATAFLQQNDLGLSR
ncbi:conserved hypothetical protein [Verticillium alfalfae VaMs.102]|uniref:Uncharacterized protein n=1 Tax=Verticillium alfalfae (strain VaMs.102 / ATCC MYA-4576 / FGSC 10136) TaxID=526221 RepID=C9SNK8_VERA1|nr:conserved hypothetical protein [Verticillium alfalfae VaMs.102]EEY20373.1 conserved hypothetical protein [Verticillium alfalfae VaMs.102]